MARRPYAGAGRGVSGATPHLVRRQTLGIGRKMSFFGVPGIALTSTKMDRQQHSTTPISAFELISSLWQACRCEWSSGSLTKLALHDGAPRRILGSRFRLPDVKAADPVRRVSRHTAHLVEPEQHDLRRASGLGQDG